VFEWRVAVSCPVRPVAGKDAVSGNAHQRELYVWTDHPSAVDAYDEALRVLTSWPAGSRPVDVAPVGLYVPAHSAVSST